VTTPQIIRIFGVPMDLGQNRRGVDMGPSAIRYAGLQDRLGQLGFTVHDGGNITVPVVEEIAPATSQASGDAAPLRHLNAVTQVCTDIYNTINRCVQDGEMAIFLGGDHSISIGTVSGISKQRKPGVIWVDAHADYNTPKTSPSGNIHGMPVASLLGEGPEPLVNLGYPGPKLDPSQVVMIGIRNLDLEERRRVAASGIKVFTVTDIDEQGIASITRQALDHLSRFDALHISLDMDSLDPDVAPGVGTPIPGGLTYREAHLLMEILASSHKIRSMDIVEINPILDNHNQTAVMAVELAASLFGKRIL
jgi:arginase